VISGSSGHRAEHNARPCVFLAACAAALAAWSFGAQTAAAQTASAPTTFARDVAPILYAQCANCHRAEGSAPFSVITYEEVRPRAAQIVKAIQSRAMPPWKPAAGTGPFVGERRLTDREIDLIARWEREGAREGDRGALPQIPHWNSGWQLGTPDLVVELPEYTLPAGIADTFRNFVVSLPTNNARNIRGLEFRPGNPIVHHANLFVDTTRASRRLDEADPAPGYEGLIPFSAAFPEGHILAWTPGQIPTMAPHGMAWRLEPGTDLLVQLHMQPTPTPVRLRPIVGLFFTNDAPTLVPTALRLGRQDIDIAAGDASYRTSDSYVVPVDAQVQAIQPHAHARAREVQITAELPDATGRTLLAIRDWDSHWQDVYRFAAPVWLPAGTTLVTTFTFDNSAANRRNPDTPAKRVTWGVTSSDEMGHAWIQVLTRSEHDRRVLAADFRLKQLAEDITGYETRIRLRPEDSTLRDDVALLYLAENKPEPAIGHFEASLRLRPDSPAAHNNLGTALEAAGRLSEAERRYRDAIQQSPDYVIARNNLARVLTAAGRLEEATDQYRAVLRLSPANADAHNNFGNILLARGLDEEAIAPLERALQLNPNHPEAHFNLARLLVRGNRDRDAVVHFREALRLRQDWPSCLASLAWILGTHGGRTAEDRREAVTLATRAAMLTARQDGFVLDALAAAYAATGRFGDALVTARAALEQSSAAGLTELSAGIQRRLSLYATGKPYVE
jgi:tetratricopeptide (TPR) repeat protein/mono/diheme cytochrome c family protein